MSPPSVLVLNGPNLNMLGVREPEIYGKTTLAEIEAMVRREAERLGVVADFRQSNYEGELIEWIQQARGKFEGIIINPAAYTHTSIAIYDALRLAECVTIELHLANYHKREAFRERSFVSPVAAAIICGLGAYGYVVAIGAMKHLIEMRTEGRRP